MSRDKIPFTPPVSHPKIEQKDTVDRKQQCFLSRYLLHRFRYVVSGSGHYTIITAGSSWSTKQYFSNLSQAACSKNLLFSLVQKHDKPDCYFSAVLSPRFHLRKTAVTELNDRSSMNSFTALALQKTTTQRPNRYYRITGRRYWKCGEFHIK